MILWGALLRITPLAVRCLRWFVGGIVVVSTLIVLGLQSELKASDWAAWVQAVGSICAIFASAAVVWWQVRRQHDLQVNVEFTRQLSREIDVLTSFCDVARLAEHNLRAASQQMIAPDVATSHLAHAYKLAEFDLVETALDATPHQAMTKPNLILALLSVKKHFRKGALWLSDAGYLNRVEQQSFLDELRQDMNVCVAAMNANTSILEMRRDELISQRQAATGGSVVRS